MVAETGLPPHDVSRLLQRIVLDYDMALEVDAEGTLVYRRIGGLSAREDIVKADRRRRLRAVIGRALRAGFKALTVGVVVVYTIIYVTLLIAFLVVVLSQRKGGGRSIGRRTSSDPFRLIRSWAFWSMVQDGNWSRRRRLRRIHRDIAEGRDPYHLSAPQVRKPDKPSIVARTWYFLFGARSIEQTPLEREKELLTYIRAKRGLITNADIIALTGTSYDEADAIGTRLTAAYGGELDITDDGIAIYRFPDVMVSGHPAVARQEPRLGYLWQLREREHVLRQYPERLIPSLNGFNLLLSVFSYTHILPTLGITGLAALGFLVVFPAAFSMVFFGIALLRKLREKRGEVDYDRDNLRISIYRLLMARGKPVVLPRDAGKIADAGLGSWTPEEIAFHANDIAQAIRGEVEEDGSGRVVIKAPRIWDELRTVEKLRRSADPARPVGKTVFSSHEVRIRDEVVAEAIEAL